MTSALGDFRLHLTSAQRVVDSPFAFVFGSVLHTARTKGTFPSGRGKVKNNHLGFRLLAAARTVAMLHQRAASK